MKHFLTTLAAVWAFSMPSIAGAVSVTFNFTGADLQYAFSNGTPTANAPVANPNASGQFVLSEVPGGLSFTMTQAPSTYFQDLSGVTALSDPFAPGATGLTVTGSTTHVITEEHIAGVGSLHGAQVIFGWVDWQSTSGSWALSGLFAPGQSPGLASFAPQSLTATYDMPTPTTGFAFYGGHMTTATLDFSGATITRVLPDMPSIIPLPATAVLLLAGLGGLALARRRV